VSLLSSLICVINLLLNGALVLLKVCKFLLVVLTLHLVADFLVSEHGDVDLGILFLHIATLS